MFFLTLRALLRIERKIDLINERLHSMATDLSTITDAVTRSETVSESVLTLVQSMAQKITDLSNQTSDPATQQALADLASSLNAESDKIASAVTANTPAAPAT